MGAPQELNYALTRTRRNMIAVSVVLILVYSFDWGFPTSLSVFGNTIDTHGTAIEWLAWISLIYFVYEYVVHMQSERESIYRPFIDRYTDLIKVWAFRKMITEYDEPRRQEIFEKNDLAGQFRQLNEPEDIQFTRTPIKLRESVIPIRVVLPAERANDTTKYTHRRDEDLKLPIAIRIWFAARAAARALLRNEAWFEHVVPMGFPVFAVLAAFFGPFPLFANDLYLEGSATWDHLGPI